MWYSKYLQVFDRPVIEFPHTVKQNIANKINKANKRTKIKNGNILCGSAIPSIDVMIPYEKTIIKNDTITNNEKIRLKRI